MPSPVEIARSWKENPCKFVYDNFQVTPDKWQENALKAFARKDMVRMRISFQACAGPGKLLSDDTLVPTPEGMAMHGDLRPGDRVFAEDGTVTKVKATILWEDMIAVRIKFSDGTSVVCAGQHLWKVRSRFYEGFKDWTVLEAQEIAASRPIVIRGNGEQINRFEIPATQALQYPRRDLPIDPYLLGCWLGDGARLSGFIIKDDMEPFQEIERRGYSLSKAKKFPKAGQRYHISGLKATLRDMGIGGLYSYERFVPDGFKFASCAQRRDLLGGLLDTDARIKTNGMLDFCSTSRRLIEDVAWLVRSLGGYANLGREVDTHRKRPCYSVGIRLPFNPFRIKRKAERWRKPPDYRMRRKMTAIEPFGRISGTCIEIEHPSGCYVAGDGVVVTHNSAALAWMGWNFLSCYGTSRDHPKGAAVGVTKDNLDDNLWSELAKWRGRSPMLMKAYGWNRERCFSKQYPETWFLSARSWAKTASAEDQGKTLSGLHSKYVLALVDESGEIPLAVLRAAEQALAQEDCEFGRIIQAGNPTSLSGMLHAASSELAEQWHIIRISGDPDDPDRSPRINIEWAEKQIAQWGRDNPWVMAYILGLFPPGGINSLLGVDEVRDAMERYLKQEDFYYAQKRLGIDVARFGDDRTILFPRQGRLAHRSAEMRNARGPDIAARAAVAKKRWDWELAFIDSTGGYGASVEDSMEQAGLNYIPVNFAGKAIDPRYFNTRSEIYFKMAEWVKTGGCLPNEPDLVKELTAPTYTFQGGKFRLEEKAQIKERLGFSPDKADGLALTFSLEELPTGRDKTLPHILAGASEHLSGSTYDPFKGM